MKKIIYLIAVLATFASCTNEENISVSQTELHFSPQKSEQVVSITSDLYWDYEYNANWLLVRQNQNKIRVIVDENPTTEERTDIITITSGNSDGCEIKVVQAGIKISVADRNIEASSKEEVISVNINSNVNWSIDCDSEWCTAKINNNMLELSISRNYSLTERICNILLSSGNASQTITLTQYGCEWFESFEMIDVDSGTFFMGAQKTMSNGQNYDESAYVIESPVHKVTLSAYSIGKYEVTQAQWMAAMGSNPSTKQGDDFPVENVTWEDVQDFINVLNEASGLNYRLPTEAEWEFAAKGGNHSEGYRYSGNNVIGACAWYYSNSNNTTHKVGSKNCNELGIFDMTGNVREWCNDWFEYYNPNDVENPQGKTYGDSKVNRGGSWTTQNVNCRNTYRHTNLPHESAHDLGFRLVLEK